MSLFPPVVVGLATCLDGQELSLHCTFLFISCMAVLDMRTMFMPTLCMFCKPYVPW